jgi:predicted secreted acid phosphatase
MISEFRRKRLDHGRAARAVAPLMVAACLLIAPMAMACPCSEIPKPDPNKPELVRDAGIKYTYTAEYRKQFADAIADARKAVVEHMNEARPAVVADIDETILDNREEFETHPDFKWAEFERWMQKADAPTLKPTADFLGWARKQGFAVFLITGRPEHDRAATIQNLVRRGIAYDALYMRPGDDMKDVAEEVKTAWRKKIEDMGFKVVVNIGDQFSDLYGGYSIDCEKLPNKMYYIP